MKNNVVIKVPYSKAQIDAKLAIIASGLDWREPVANFAALSTTYPDAVDGWTASVLDTDIIYRFNGIDWINIISGLEPAITNATPLATNYLNGNKGWTDFATSVRATILTGLTNATSQVIAVGDTVLQALGYLQGQITTKIGDLTTLVTTAKTSSVSAINEIFNKIGAASGIATLGTDTKLPYAQNTNLLVSTYTVPTETAVAVTIDAGTGVFTKNTHGYLLNNPIELYSTDIRAGVAQAGGNNTITLDADASAVDDFYKDKVIVVNFDTKLITGYVGSTKIATVSSDWVANPAIGTAYTISGQTNMPILRANTAQAGANTTITLDGGASSENNYYQGATIIVGTDVRMITGYVGSTRIATVSTAWTSNPASGTAFTIYLTNMGYHNATNIATNTFTLIRSNGASVYTFDSVGTNVYARLAGVSGVALTGFDFDTYKKYRITVSGAFTLLSTSETAYTRINNDDTYNYVMNSNSSTNASAPTYYRLCVNPALKYNNILETIEFVYISDTKIQIQGQGDSLSSYSPTLLVGRTIATQTAGGYCDTKGNKFTSFYINANNGGKFKYGTTFTIERML